MTMARFTARIKRLEALSGVGARDKYAHLSDAEMKARICQVAEKLSDGWRNRGMSIAKMTAETGYPADDPRFAAVYAEAQAPAFNAERLLAALFGRPLSPDADAPDPPQERL